MILNEPFNKERLNNFLKDFLPDYQRDEHLVRTPDKSILTEVTQLGVSRKAEVTVLEAECEETDSKKRIAITQAAFKVLRDHGVRNAIIAFHDGADQWRLSLLTSTLEIKGGKVIKKDSNPRRYSYLLGVGAKTVTPYKYLVEKGRVDDIKQLQERFSVEVVNKQFYASIADLFTKLVGGERGATKHPGLLKINGVISQNVEHQEFAVRLIGRIIFSWFLKEKKSSAGVPIVPNELLSLDAVASNADYYHSILEPLFFELLNKRVENRHESLREVPFSTVPYLNGGLFSPQISDFYNQNSFNGAGTPGLTHIPDNWFTELFTVLEQYNFTVDENTSYDVDLSIDPEMLGRIFENLLAEINPETGESARKSTGSFYTPREIVDYMVDSSLLEFLKGKTGTDEAKLKALISWGQVDDDEYPLSDDEKQKVVTALAGLTILDPACGSGAFPIGILQKVVYVLQQVDERSELWFKSQLDNIKSIELRRELEEKQRNENYDYIRKLGVIRESIFGVDIQTIATEISRLRCFLTLIIEEEVDDTKHNRGIRPLPNLDFKFVTANSLIDLPRETNGKQVFDNGQSALFEDINHIDELRTIRSGYFTASTEERQNLRNRFDSLQKKMFMKTLDEFKGQSSGRYSALSRWEPFEHKATEWFNSEWMFGVDKFDIVIANPPYVKVSQDDKYWKIYKDNFKFANTGKLNLYKIFYEKGIDLLKQNGVLCFISPNTYIADSESERLRELFIQNDLIEIIEYTERDRVFENVTQAVATLLMIKRPGEGQISIKTHKQGRHIFDKTLLLQSPNYLIPLNDVIKKVRNGNKKRLEKSRVYQGEVNLTLKRDSYSTTKTASSIKMWRGDNVGKWIPTSEPDEFYNLQGEVRNHYLEERIVLQQVSNQSLEVRLKAFISPPNYACGNSTNYILGNDLHYLLGLINSRLFNYYFNYFSFTNHITAKELCSIPLAMLPNNQKQTIENLVREIIATKTADAHADTTVLESQIDHLVYSLYNLTPEEIAIVEDSSK